MRSTGVVDSVMDNPMNDALNDDPATGPMGDPLAAVHHDPMHPLNARNPAAGAVNAPPTGPAADVGAVYRREERGDVPLVPADGLAPGEATALRAAAVGAQAVGALAIGACAVGALAIGFLAVKRLRVRDARFCSVAIDELSVDRLRVGELVVTGPVRLPDDTARLGWSG